MNATEHLPLPVAGLLRRSANAKSAKQRHDTAYWAWEASLKLAVAANPPEHRAPLIRGSAGHWVSALKVSDEKIGDPAVVDCYLLFRSAKESGGADMRAVSPARVLAALPRYRNEVIGHGSSRDRAFYLEASGRLIAGLEGLWRHGAFWPCDAKLVYVETLEIDPAGKRRARLLDLTGELVHVIDPRGTTDLPELLQPGRLYLRRGSEFRSLHPWLLFEEWMPLERVFFFNRLTRTPDYLDYLSGESLKGRRFQERFPEVESDVRALFDVSPEDGVTAMDVALDGEDKFGDFQLQEKIGEGGMGIVHLAVQESLDRQVAVKILPDEMAEHPVAVARFRQEIAALSRCDHPNVVKILTSGDVRATHFYAMEYVDGVDLSHLREPLSKSEDLASALDRVAAARAHEVSVSEDASADGVPARRPPGHAVIRELVRLFRDAARGVDHLHEHGVIHRDLKPGNLILTFHERRIVIMDLGLAKVREASRSITLDRSHILGTLRYIPPEQLQRSLTQVDHRADIYSLGATFYELLTGRPMYAGESEARIIEQVLMEDPPPPRRVNPAVSKDLATVLRKATEKHPKLRYETAAQLADDLEAILADRPISARPPNLGYLLRLVVKRHKVGAAAAIAALVLIVGLLIGYALSQREWAKALAFRVDTLQSGMLLEERKAAIPLSPASVPALTRWIRTTEDLLGRRDLYRRRLAENEASATASVEREQLESLVANLAELVEKRLPHARKELEAATRVRARSIETHADEWRAAIEDIERQPIYESVGRIPPQIGLVPLRRDPDSGLWEFWVVLSGERPVIDPETDRWVIGPETGMVLVLLPGGPFMMGSPKDEELRDDNEQQHKVHLLPFFIGKYEVTQAQWQRWMYANPAFYQPGTVKGGQTVSLCNPVENVNWRECAAFVRRLGLAFATEAQWEYAARAGSTRPYVFGDVWQELEGKGNFRDRMFETEGFVEGFAPWRDHHLIHAPVGAFLPNGYGLFDMLGNVAEWLADVHDDDYPPDSNEPSDGLNRDACGAGRIVRGGGWHVAPPYVRVALRGRDAEAGSNMARGLRVARPIARR